MATKFFPGACVSVLGRQHVEACRGLVRATTRNGVNPSLEPQQSRLLAGGHCDVTSTSG